MALTSLILAALLPYGPASTEAPTPPAPTPPTAPAPLLDEDGPDGKWHGFVDVGATYAEGNTDLRSFQIAAEAILRNEMDRYTVGAYYNLTETEISTPSGNELSRSEDRWGIDAKYDRFISEKFYWNLLAGAQSDNEAALDLRYYVGAGVGYQFIDNDETSLLGEAGIVYFEEQFENSADDADYIAARIAYDLSHQFTETTLFEQKTEVFPSLEDIEDFYGRVDSKLSFPIKDNWNAFIQHIYDYDNTPASGNREADTRVAVGVSLKY